MIITGTLSLLGLIIGSASAQIPAPEQPVAPAAELNVFGVPEEAVKVIDNSEFERPQTAPAEVSDLPACDNPALMQKVREEIRQFEAKTPPSNTYERRRRQLLVKNIGVFAEQETAKFRPAENYALANRLITLKINQRMTDADFRLCKAQIIGGSQPVYLLMYPSQAGPRGEIINFPAAETDRIEFDPSDLLPAEDAKPSL